MNQVSTSQAVPAGACPVSSVWEATRWSLTQIWRGAMQMVRMPKAGSASKRPAHVPAERVVDFDFLRAPGLADDVLAVWKQLQSGPEIFWTPRNGGYWVVTRAEDIESVIRDPETYSSAQFAIPRDSTTFKLLPIEADPPEHAAYRNLINPWFTPKAVSGMETDIRAQAVELIEGFRQKGECEFVEEFAKRLPIVIFLNLVNLPVADREKLLLWTEDVVRATSLLQRLGAFFKLNGYLDKWIRERQKNPGTDLISRVVTASFNGRPVTHDEIHGLLTVLMLGGLDTVAAMLSFTTAFLASHPAHRQQLLDDPALIPRAVDELMRRYGIVNVARVVTRDHVYKGVQFKEGDQIQVPTALFGLDEAKFVDSMTVDFTRSSSIHTAFGSGVHRCPGSFLARTELRVFLEEWLKRIPDFSVAPGKTARCTPGNVNSMEYLPLTWPVK